jgi:hypothetical protein
VFAVSGEYHNLLAILFPPAPEGRVSFGWATSTEPIPDLVRLADWTPFRDYIMEGFVFYSVRARAMPSGLSLEVRLKGSNRDRYVAPSVKDYIRWAGLEAVPFEAKIDA